MPARTTRSTARKGATATRKGSARAQAAEADEYAEVKGGDFPDSWDFEEQGDLLGTYLGSKVVPTKHGDRTVHQFQLANGEEVDAWGTAILNSRLADVDSGQDVKVVKTGDKVKTKAGSAWEFKVFVKKGAVAR